MFRILSSFPKVKKLIWIFKTKRDSNGNIRIYKDLIIKKGFILEEVVYNKDTFFLVSLKDYFKW